MRLLELFSDVDDFCQLFLPQWQAHLIQAKQRRRLRPKPFINQ